MPVKIEIKQIDDISTKMKNGKVLLTLETSLHPGEVARLLHIKGAPMRAEIVSDQATFDLRFDTVNTETGQVVDTPLLRGGPLPAPPEE